MTSSSREPALANNRAGEYRMTDTQIPPSMKPWAGGDSAPEDWEGGPVLLRGGEVERPGPDGFDWTHFPSEVADCLSDIIAYTPKSPPTVEGDATRYRHKKRGTEYSLIGVGRAQGSLSDEDPVVLYRGDDGGLWVRHQAEFSDGRFEEVVPTPPINRDDAEARAGLIEAEAIDILVDLLGPGASQSGTNRRVVEDHLKQFARSLAALSAFPSQPVDRANDEQRAREVLAREYAEIGDSLNASRVRHGHYVCEEVDIAIRAMLAFASPVDGGEVGRRRGQEEGFAAAVRQLRELSAQKPRHPLCHEAATLADALERSRLPAKAALASQGDRTGREPRS